MTSLRTSTNDHLFGQLLVQCKRLYVTAVINDTLREVSKNYKVKTMHLPIANAYSHNHQFYIKCSELNFNEKINITADLVKSALESGFQIIVFCDVRQQLIIACCLFINIINDLYIFRKTLWSTL